MVDWTFVWMMFVLKLPIVGLLWIVWWAVRSTPDEADGPADEGEGGTKVRHHHPRPPRPSRRRPRGPHGDPSPPAPARTRVTVARAREHT